MKHFENRKQIRSRFYSKLTIVGLLLVIAILGNGVWNIYGKHKQSRELRREAEARLASIEKQKQSLKGKTDKLETDAGIEEEIRTKFNVVKPGEHVVMIVNPEEATSTSTTTKGFFGKLWGWIGL